MPTRAATTQRNMLRGITMQWLLDPEHVNIVAAITEFVAALDLTLGATS
jgi:hypothetical protein